MELINVYLFFLQNIVIFYRLGEGEVVLNDEYVYNR